jgi:hypothetical protein
VLPDEDAPVSVSGGYVMVEMLSLLSVIVGVVGAVMVIWIALHYGP